MERYIGTKIINAEPMTRRAYSKFRGWKLGADESPSDDGYLVEYTDGGKPNTEDFSGYVSWSPKDVFEGAYHQLSDSHSITFSIALEALKSGCKVARKGWNGKDMWVALQMPGESKMSLPYFYMRTACNNFVPWLAYQTDMLADDWVIID